VRDWHKAESAIGCFGESRTLECSLMTQSRHPMRRLLQHAVCLAAAAILKRGGAGTI
jgi:hypothetical protein